MAKIWFAKDGAEPTHGGPLAELPLLDALKKFDVKSSEVRVCRIEDGRYGPRFGDVQNPISAFSAYTHVILEISSDEGKQLGLRERFFEVPILPEAAAKQLER
jgi:hypothetical protein